MSNMELEVKVLDIDMDKLSEKILGLGGNFIKEEEQYLYTFDLPTIYGRYLDILIQLNEPENPVKYDVAMEKLILADKENSCLQQMQEIEIKVSSKEDANNFLEALGLSHKCYLEKKRSTYSLKDHLIEIDTWPKIPTYFELEGKDEEDIENVLNLLGYSMKDKNVVSCIVDEIYEMYGYPKTTNFKELKF